MYQKPKLLCLNMSCLIRVMNMSRGNFNNQIYKNNNNIMDLWEVDLLRIIVIHLDYKLKTVYKITKV